MTVLRAMVWMFVSATLAPGVVSAQSGSDGKSAATNAAPWGQFLGPNRNGISPESGLIDSIPPTGPQVVWRVKGGVGMSGLAVAGPSLCTIVQRNGMQQLVSLDARNGKELWQTDLAPEYKNQMGNGPRATPTVFDGLVCAFTGEGILTVAAAGDGKVLWSHNVVKEQRGQIADYGMACSPLVLEKERLVVVTVGAPKATLAAYDVASGKLAWTSGDDPAGYSSPALLRVGGQEQVVAYNGKSVMGVNPKTGDLLWRYEYVTDFDCNIATPIAYKGQVFISSGENHGSALLSLKPSGKAFEATETWSSHGPKSVLRNEWQTSILIGDALYGFDNVGSAGPVTHLTCINVADGKKLWEKLRFGKGNMILADGKLFVVTIDGDLVIVKAKPDKYEELGRATVMGFTRTAPALANGLMFLRDDNEIVCLDVRKK